MQGNFIGTDATGTAPLANGGNGVLLRPRGGINFIGAAAPGAGNTIAFNGADGVLVDTSIYNAIRSNAIFSNTNLGIELINGGNNDQAFPDLTLATSASRVTTIEGTLQSTPHRTFRLEFFSNTICNPSGFGEGEQLLGFIMVTSNAGGYASFTATFDVEVPPGQFTTATATENNNTSQFSACLEVTEAAATGLQGPGQGSSSRLFLALWLASGTRTAVANRQSSSVAATQTMPGEPLPPSALMDPLFVATTQEQRASAFFEVASARSHARIDALCRLIKDLEMLDQAFATLARGRGSQ